MAISILAEASTIGERNGCIGEVTYLCGASKVVGVGEEVEGTPRCE